jgi:hypothetical protein
VGGWQDATTGSAVPAEPVLSVGRLLTNFPVAVLAG